MHRISFDVLIIIQNEGIFDVLRLAKAVAVVVLVSVVHELVKGCHPSLQHLVFQPQILYLLPIKIFKYFS